MNLVLSLRNVHHSFPVSHVHALRGVDLEVTPGEWVSLVGPNGSGKSTLGRICAGLVCPDKGEVQWTGVLPPGWMTQDPDDSLIGITVGEDVAFGPSNCGLVGEELRSRVAGSLAAVGLGTDILTRDPLHLSGGERQRVVLAALLAMRLPLLILDEPTSMLDARSAARVVGAVRKATTELGIAVLYITHDLSEALLSHRVIALQEGRVIADGEPGEVLRCTGVLRSLGSPVPPLLRLADELGRRGRRIDPLQWSVEGVSRALSDLGDVCSSCA